MSMPRLTMLCGVVLIVLGVGGYLFTGAASLTALIPAVFGLLLALLGLLGRREGLRRHVMHAAAVLALLGGAGTVGGLGRTITLIGGGSVERPEASVVQAVMALLCAVYLVFAVRSFIAARRNRVL